VLFAWLLLGQLPTVLQFVGGGLILAGVALVRLAELRPPAAPEPGHETDAGLADALARS
jgi:drug/metabolite transporter (DMT)-like permease